MNLIKSNSKIIFGSMRMIEYNYSIDYWVDLFKKLFYRGVKIHHVSNEYKSFSLYIIAYNKFKKLYPDYNIKHIVKLAEPHFSDETFSQQRLFDKVSFYLNKLNSEKLYGIQWMWRSTSPNSKVIEEYNLKILTIRNAFDKLKENKQIENLFVFPYFKEFAFATLEADKLNFNFFDGFIVYRNKKEIIFDDILRTTPKINLILRPLFGGKLDNSISPREAIDFSLKIDNVEGAIVSISSLKKLIQLLE